MTVYGLDGMAPDLAGQCWIAPTASVIGRVRLGEEASVWFGAVLRGDNEPIVVGERSNIQDLALVHTDPGFPVTIGAGCTIGHRAILHGCTIGENSLIGMGATLLNGAAIGRNCIVGAGALVAEGKTIADNSLVVGMPGKVIRTLGEDAMGMLREAADIYVARWRDYRDSLETL
ncbi:MAG TPA: gamma carbonic anhydrase family protein [Afifellaceae bacterium]|nr:gamma carbonic anhydrase family protein [Afifellaceae bacterium]